MIFSSIMVAILGGLDRSNQDLKPVFLTHAKSQAVDFGVPGTVMDRLVSEICLDVYRMPSPSTAMDVRSLAKHLLTRTDSVLQKSSVANPSKLLRQWLYAEAICAWVVSKVDGDEELAAEKDFKRWWEGSRPSATLAKKPIRTICSGSAWLARDLTRAMKSSLGIDARYIGGWLRSDDGTVTKSSNHAWTLFVFEGGIEVPADVVSPLDPIESRSKWSSKRGAWPILPRSRESWEVFLAFHYGVEAWTGDDWAVMPKTPQDPLTKLTFPRWKEITEIGTALALRRQRRWVD